MGELFLCETKATAKIANDWCKSFHSFMPSGLGKEQEECHCARTRIRSVLC